MKEASADSKLSDYEIQERISLTEIGLLARNLLSSRNEERREDKKSFLNLLRNFSKENDIVVVRILEILSRNEKFMFISNESDYEQGLDILIALSQLLKSHNFHAVLPTVGDEAGKQALHQK